MKKISILTSMILVLSVPAMAYQPKVLPLDIYSAGVHRAQAQQILDKIVERLKKYKKYRVMTPPHQNPLDMILNAGFMDLNAKSLASIGKSRGADIVLYSEIKKEDGRYYLYIQKVDVATKKQVRAKGGIGASLSHPDNGVAITLNQVLGPIPKPAPMLTTVSVVTRPPGAEVYLGTKFLDKTPLVTKLKPGTYKLKISKAGYKDQVRTIAVKRGEPLELGLKMERILIPKPTVPPGQQRKRVEKETHWYQTWWFWTAVGVVVVAGVTTGAVLGTRSHAGPTGSVQFLMDPTGAYQDFSVQGK